MLLLWHIKITLLNGNTLVNFNHKTAAYFLFPITVSCFTASIFCIIAYFIRCADKQLLKVGVFTCALIFAQFAQIALTGNNWLNHSGWFAVYSIIILITVSDLGSKEMA